MPLCIILLFRRRNVHKAAYSCGIDYFHRLRRDICNFQFAADFRCAAEIELSGYGKIAGELLDYVNKLIETVVIAGEKNPKVTVTITI